jgi:hypothetical protein
MPFVTPKPVARHVRFGSLADIRQRGLDVRFVPIADSCSAASGFHIDHQVELSWLLDRKISGLGLVQKADMAKLPPPRS